MGTGMGVYRSFVYWFLGLILLFVIFNFVIWKGYTERLLGANSAGGDLARLGYIPWIKQPRKNSSDLPRKHIEQQEYAGQPIRILTFGDSFSNGGGGGRNRYYQDYMASINDCNVLNIEPFQEPDFMESIAIMYNNGYLDTLRPKYLLLSSSEKLSIGRFARDVDFSKNMGMEELLRHKRMGYNVTAKPGTHTKGVQFINSGNYRFLEYSLLYRFSSNAFFSKVFQVTLTQPFFNNSKPNTLLFYRDDVSSIFSATPATVGKMNENLNLLSDMLMKKGIKLYFMPCVDKYDLYSGYIVKNKFPQSVFFDELRKLPRRYVLIDTKAILAEELRRGEKDVFFADDTHWTWKAAQKIFETVRFP